MAADDLQESPHDREERCSCRRLLLRRSSVTRALERRSSNLK